MPDTAVIPSHAAPRIGQSLTIAALGVVYGDIGTSPLYTVKQCFDGVTDITPDVVLGVLSLIAWSLTSVVTLKYVIVIMRADNRGEGGILQTMTHGERKMTMPTWPVRFDGVPTEVKSAPLLGEHTAEVLADWLGLDDAAIAGLRRDGIV